MRSAREDLARALARAEEVAWQRDVARAQAGRWRLEYRAALKSRDLALARRDALASALPGALSAVLSTARAAAWDEGWQDARAGGLVQGQNPYSADDDPVPGSPAARLTTCRAYLHFLAERRQAGPAPGHRP